MSTAALVPAGTEETKEVARLFVVFKVGSVDYALAADEVLQMESYAGATTVPGARSFIKGIIQLRGRVVPVIDLRARFGLAPMEPTLESRVVVGANRPEMERAAVAQHDIRLVPGGIDRRHVLHLSTPRAILARG